MRRCPCGSEGIFFYGLYPRLFGARGAIPVSPLASEVVFANRCSLAVINAGTVISIREEDRAKLAGLFYNDAYWFDQKARAAGLR